MPGIMKEGNIFTIGASFFSRLRCFALADRSIADCRCLYLTEPMINMGASSLIHWKDDWTATTRDGKRSAQFEETILFVPFFLPLLTLSCTSADLLLPLCLHAESPLPAQTSSPIPRCPRRRSNDDSLFAD